MGDFNIPSVTSPLFKAEFTYQLSDHLPLWVQINTDTDDQKLEQLIQG